MKLRATPRAIGYFIVLALSLAPAILTNSIAGYFPFCTLLMCALLSLLQLVILKHGLGYETATGTGALVRGEQTPFQVELHNRSFLPVTHLRAEFFVSDPEGTDSHTYPLDITLSPRERRTFRLKADFPHLGVYLTGVRRVVIYDLFGNFQFVGAGGEPQTVEIQPRILTLAQLPVTTLQLLENQRSVAAAPLSGMDYAGVREYAYGDPIKTIQWKLSAHAGGLLTKQMESYTNTGVAIALDFCIPGYEQETRLDLLDAIVETGVSVGHYAVREGMEYELLYVSAGGENRRCTPASFADIRMYLPEFRPRPDRGGMDETAHLLEECGGGIHGQSNVVLCTARLTQEMIQVLLRLRQAQKNVMVYYFLPDSVYDNERQELLAPLRHLQYAQIPCVVAGSAEGMVCR